LELLLLCADVFLSLLCASVCEQGMGRLQEDRAAPGLLGWMSPAHSCSVSHSPIGKNAMRGKKEKNAFI